MKKIKHLTTLIGASLCIMLSACDGGKNDNTAGDDRTAAVADAAAVYESPEQNVVSEKQVSRNAVLYLDCSHSMSGYLKTATDDTFNNVISSLVYLFPPTQTCLFDTKEQPEISSDEFINLINACKVPWSDESDLEKMIGSMVGKVKEGSAGIAYLITDGIMSGSNKQIRESVERSFNIKNRGRLTGGIAAAVSACNDDMEILLIKYTSKFDGKYYDYKNDAHNLKDKDRPFYVVAIGNRTLVKEMVDKIRKDKRLGNNKGLLLLGDGPYNISLVAKTGNGIISRKDGTTGIGSNVDSVHFAGYLRDFQSYMQTTGYFEKNGEVYIQYDPTGEFKKLDPEYVAYNSDGTNIDIRVLASILKGNAMYFRLRYELPDWIELSSCDNDLNIEQQLVPQTFNFKYFVEGLAQISKDEYVTKADTLKFK